MREDNPGEDIEKTARDDGNETEKKEKPDTYQFLPKHIAMFSPGKNRSQEEEQPQSDAQIIWEVVRKSWVTKTILYIAIPMVILDFWLFRWDDFRNGCHIKINISLLEWNNLEIKRALRFLRDKSPADYKDTCRYVDKINPDLPCGGSGGGCFHSSSPREIEVSVMGHSNISQTSAMIIHETCHSIQNEQKRPFSESECYGEMNRFMAGIGEDSPWKNYK